MAQGYFGSFGSEFLGARFRFLIGLWLQDAEEAEVLRKGE